MNLRNETAIDPILSWIESEWINKTQEKDQKSRAKLLRLLVNHVKVREGVPLEYQEGIRDKVTALVNDLEFMEIDEAGQTIAVIDHANRSLNCTTTFGTGFKTDLSAIELKSIRRKHRSLKLVPSSTEPEKPSVDRGLDDVCS